MLGFATGIVLVWAIVQIYGAYIGRTNYFFVNDPPWPEGYKFVATWLLYEFQSGAIIVVALVVDTLMRALSRWWGFPVLAWLLVVGFVAQYFYFRYRINELRRLAYRVKYEM